MPLKQATISNLFKEKINLIAIAFCAASFFFWVFVIANWYYFRYTGGWDTAYFLQTLWGLGRGNFNPSVLNASFISDHCHLFSLIIAPLYWIFPDPLLLQYIKIGGFFAGAYLLFLILKKHLPVGIALAAMIAFTITPANVAMLRFAFSYETLAIPLILLIFKAFDDQKYPLYIVGCVLLIMVKEQMPLVVMSFGVAALFLKEDRFKWGWVPILMGLSIFVLEISVFLPYLREKMHISQFLYWNRYARFGSTPQEVFWFLLTHPAVVWRECLSPMNIRWFNDLCGPWGALGFLSPHVLLPALPLFLKMALSSESVEHSVTTVYYASIFTPFIFLATWNTLSYFQDKWRVHFFGFVLVLMFIHAFNYMPLWLGALPQDTMSANLLATQRFIDEIPSSASVLSSRKAMPYLANREKLYQFKDYLDGQYYISGKKFNLPKDIDYLLIDFSEINVKKYIPKITALNTDDHFKLKESIEDVALFVKNSPPERAHHLIERSIKPLNGHDPVHLDLDNAIGLESLDYFKIFPGRYRIFPVTMYWKAIGKPEVSYELLLKITSQGKVYYEKQRTIGSVIYPTDFWNKSEYVREEYFYLLPHLSKGKYEMEVQIVDPATKKHSQTKKFSFLIS